VQHIGWRLPLKIDIGEKRPRLGKIHMVAGAFRAQGRQVFIEAGRLGEIASDLGGMRRPVERIQAVRFQWLSGVDASVSTTTPQVLEFHHRRRTTVTSPSPWVAMPFKRPRYAPCIEGVDKRH
jgi:hypothetical protein